MARLFLPLVVTAAAVVNAEKPVQKVVSLLTDMQTQMEKDSKDDLAAFKKMECWCKTHRTKKGDAVIADQKIIKRATDTIAARTGTISALETEMKNLEADIAAAQEDIKSAANLRQKEAAEAGQSQKDMSDTITALTTALEILSKVQGGFIQHPTAFVQVKQTLAPFRNTLRSDLWGVLGKLDSARQLREGNSRGFLQQEEEPVEERTYESGPVGPNANKGAVAGAKSYNSGSGAIFGLLSEMKADFEKQLKDSKASEVEKEKGFKKILKEKGAMIAESKSMMTAKKGELGTAKIEQANAKKLKEETTMSLTSDQKFIVEMEEQCKDAVDGHGARSKERADEMAAVGEAIGFLTSDEARDVFNKGFNFIQVSSLRNRKSSRDILLRSAQKSARLGHGRRALQLAELANLAKQGQGLDAFVKVKEALDKLKSELAEEQSSEFAKRDDCNSGLSENKKTMTSKTVLLEDTEAAAAEMGAKIDASSELIKADELSVTEANAMIAAATDDRKAENAAFKETVSDQELVIKVLKAALGKLESFYGKLGFLQQDAAPKQKTYRRQQGGNGALGLLHTIIADAEHVIKLSNTDEQKAEADYEKAMSDASAELKALEKSLITKKDESAKLETKKTEAEAVATQTTEELLALGKEEASLHAECDFLIKNFDVRQQARSDEMESIDQAKAVLSGADFD